ncbi:Uncharacterised protein [Bordetella ansorpii]|uniref:Uncharacterized protein n=1 Tax=Bordetella ansorpii TaxID=288768 RepID=A0A157RLP4_9BORD|nr:phage tail tube protein [Bordetella ansorpii]SAI58921.1 Uncharacterised protein [Bordetella ansorpii]
MSKSMRNQLMLVKIQAEAGTDPVPTAALNAILLRNVTHTPIAAEYVDRALLKPYMGNMGQIPVSQYAQAEFEVELAGAGTAGDTPAWGPLLRGCGFSETIDVGEEVTYAPVSTNQELVTLYYYLDGLLHKITDARGSVSFDISAKGIPFMRYRFMGTYVPIVDEAFPVGADFSRFQIPQGVTKANTPMWQLGAYTGCLRSLQADIANQLVWRALIGCEGAAITNRTPTGQLVLELPSIAQLNWPQMVLDASDQALILSHGVGAGRIVQLRMPTTQVNTPTYSDQDGVAMLNLNFNLQPSQGNDEIEIVVK